MAITGDFLMATDICVSWVRGSNVIVGAVEDIKVGVPNKRELLTRDRSHSGNDLPEV
jgi:hypothetical protein